MFMALGLVLPFFTGQVPQIGSMLLPMHIPVLLCGLICGGGWGGLVGFILPLLRYGLFGMPAIFPQGIAMAFELATYGIVAGGMYQRLKLRKVEMGAVDHLSGLDGSVRDYACGGAGYFVIYGCLITAMIAGRVVWGVVFAVLCGMADQAFTFKMFLLAAFVEAIPGIILQLVLIPVLVRAVFKANLFLPEDEKICSGKITGQS